jgi:hypothetical protein
VPTVERRIADAPLNKEPTQEAILATDQEAPMPARITCPHCHQDLRLPEFLYEGPAQCPFCDGAFAIRWRERTRQDIVPMQRCANQRRCRFCGENIEPQTVKCPKCGEQLAE